MKRNRPLDRKSGVLRDASLIIIASEDKFAVKQYFDRFKLTKVQFIVLETQDCNSSPEHVMERLINYKKERDFGDGDEFWLVCDCDHRLESNHIKNLTQVLQECKKQNIRVALSNPCFDLWLLLHFADFPKDQNLSCAQIGELIREQVGSYNKGKIYNLPIGNSHVHAAVKRAHAQSQLKDIPSSLQTSVHLIIEDLIKKRLISTN